MTITGTGYGSIGIPKKISNKRLLVKSIVVAGHVEAMACCPQNLVEWSSRWEKAKKIMTRGLYFSKEIVHG